jgi:hypothetical protein
MVCANSVQGYEYNIGFVGRGFPDCFLILQLIPIPREKGKKEEKKEDREYHETTSKERSSSPSREQTPDERDQSIQQEEKKNNKEHQEEVIENSRYLKTTGQELLVPVEFEGSHDPERGQEREIGDHYVPPARHPSQQEREKEKHCCAHAKEEDTF